jgi:hypothetical protein
LDFRLLHQRDEDWDGGHAIGSPNIAKNVNLAKGDAVIVQSQEQAGKHGTFGTAYLGAFSWAEAGRP